MTSENSLSRILDVIEKPLRFASKDDFAHLSSVKGLKELTAKLYKEAKSSGDIDDKSLDTLLRIKKLFVGYDKLSEPRKKARIEDAIDLAFALKGQALTRPPREPGLLKKRPEPVVKTTEKPKKGRAKKKVAKADEPEEKDSRGLKAKRPAKGKKKEISKSAAEPAESSAEAAPEEESSKSPARRGRRRRSGRGRRGAGSEARNGSPSSVPSTPLGRPLLGLKGVGPATAKRFEKKGLFTVEDLLYFLPIRYEDRSTIKKITEVDKGDKALVTGEVLASGVVRYGRKRRFEVAVSDGDSIVKAKWFHFRKSFTERFKVGNRLLLYGTVSIFGGQKEMVHPDVDDITGETTEGDSHGAIVPVYSVVEGVFPRRLAKIVAEIVEEFAPLAAQCAPPAISERLSLLTLKDALLEIHKVGGTKLPLDPIAKKSLIFDELFSLELGLALKRRAVTKEPGIEFADLPESSLIEKLTDSIPFKLTDAQERVVSEIDGDMRSPYPMNRLVQGDVGSGKTIVSAMAILRAVECGYQAAIMAPTEILAAQHYRAIENFFKPLGVKVKLLTGRLRKKERDAALSSIKDGEVSVVVGTHALIQKDVTFASLGLVVIDEQHRFGVVQRSLLQKQGPDGKTPDLLVMTATPIPRTLTMTVFGDMDLSLIDEMPPGRTPVETVIIRDKECEKAYEVVKEEVARGGQAYIIYPLVEESDALSLRDATNMKEKLESTVFSDLKVALLHGRMRGVEKRSVMEAFKRGDTDVLVSTTVIEVGVDIPNASVMVVEHAERFGLAQLHQLRGRVGRGVRASKCVLLASWTNSDDALARLKVMESTNDGFKIAEEDLSIRGPGDMIGTRQSGLPDFRLAAALSDPALLVSAREEALAYLETASDFSAPEAAEVLKVVKDRWAGRFEFAEIG